MTDDERRNRNPKPEIYTFRPSDCPELFTKDLELGKVYILHGDRQAATFNYAGTRIAVDADTRQNPGLAHVFVAPRLAGFEVVLKASKESGTLHSTDGTKVTLRKFNGPDA